MTAAEAINRNVRKDKARVDLRLGVERFIWMHLRSSVYGFFANAASCGPTASPRGADRRWGCWSAHAACGWRRNGLAYWARSHCRIVWSS